MDTISVAGRPDLTDAQWAVLEPLLPKGIKPGRPLADKAYSSKANRSYRRRRHIRATIPVKDDQAAHRHQRGS